MFRPVHAKNEIKRPGPLVLISFSKFNKIFLETLFMQSLTNDEVDNTSTKNCLFCESFIQVETADCISNEIPY